jgi:glycosyltransferase involved in cell wall biosynthesis
VLTIAGEGDETLLRDLIQIVEMNNLEDVVKFIGFIDGEDKHELYRDSDLLLLPSENENFAISIAEAIAHQVPVVVSQNVAMHSFVKTHQTGKIIDELNVENLAEAIISLKSDYYKYWKGCANSKSILDWNVVFGRWREILETRERS